MIFNKSEDTFSNSGDESFFSLEVTSRIECYGIQFI